MDAGCIDGEFCGFVIDECYPKHSIIMRPKADGCGRQGCNN
jgi:hypothetical protein